MARTDVPEVEVFTLGGTIDMVKRESGGAEIGRSMAAAWQRADGIRHTPVAARASASLTLDDLRHLAAALSASVAGGMVVTHGTDTMEETAFLLDLISSDERPIVLTGAMRTSDSPGSDGPANLAAAIEVARWPKACGLGPLVVMGDEIHAALWVRKAHATRAHAFTSEPMGPVGWISEGRPAIWMRPIRNRSCLALGPFAIDVAIVELAAGASGAGLQALAASYGALVLSLPGGGHLSEGALTAVTQIAAERPVVFVTRTNGGAVLQQTYGYAGSEIDLLSRGMIAGGCLTAAKARVLLRVLLSSGADRDAVCEAFTKYGPAAAS